MKQQTLAMAADHNAQYVQRRRPTRRDIHVATMDKVVSWGALCAVIEPHAPTLLKFRRRLEQPKLGEVLFAKVGEFLQAPGLDLGTGTIVHSTTIGAPTSTENAQKQRNPGTHQSRKGTAGKRCRGFEFSSCLLSVNTGWHAAAA